MLYERKDSHDRGRHLVSTQKISKGSLIFVERPLLSLQSVGNAHRGALCCRCCRAFIGGPDLSLMLASGKIDRENMWEYYKNHEKELTGDENKDYQHENYKITACRNNCGELYCSEECEANGWKCFGHDLLCTGCIPEPEVKSEVKGEIEAGDMNDELHPLLQFKLHAVENNEIFIMVGDLVATVISLRRQQIELERSNDSVKSDDDETCDFRHHFPSKQIQLDEILAPYLDFTLVPWWEVAIAPMANDPTKIEECRELAKTMKELCGTSVNLFRKALQALDGDDIFRETLSQAVKDCDERGILSELFFGQIIGSFEQNSMGLRARHPLARDILENFELRKRRHTELIRCIELAGMVDGDVDDEDNRVGKDFVPTEEFMNGTKSDEQIDEKAGAECSDVDDGDYPYTVDDISAYIAGMDINETGLPPSRTHQMEEDEYVLSNNNRTEQTGDDRNDDDSNNSCGESCDEEHDFTDDLDALFTPLDGTCMYYTTCKMNHSCDPNVMVRYNYSCSGGGMFSRWGKSFPLIVQCIALKNIEKDEELCISYINERDDVSKRREGLANYGFECQCKKCLHELKSAGYSSIEIDIFSGSEDLFGDEEDFLFGGDETCSDTDDKESDIPGTSRLEERVNELNLQSASMETGKIPINTLAPSLSFANQLGLKMLQDFDIIPDAMIGELLKKSFDGLKNRNINYYLEASIDGEQRLLSILHESGGWPTMLLREAHAFFSVVSAIGLASHGHFLPALSMLDKALIFGLPRDPIESLLRYIEMHSTNITSCHNELCRVPGTTSIFDYSRYELKQLILREGLSQPIDHPISEIDVQNCPPNLHGGNALAIRNFASKWKAIEKWRHLDYFKDSFGCRIVPIEHGDMSDRNGMQEELMTMRKFIASYLAPSSSEAVFPLCQTAANHTNVAYLAQHQLFNQISELWDDVNLSPEICGKEGPTHINMWLGTGATRTPLHFDSYDNLFVQLVGAKYVRLYDTRETEKLYVIQRGEADYAKQGNMSAVDCEREDFCSQPLLKEARYTEIVLFPGDALYIPSRVWHYVRSLSTSASVNYWW